jgi:hypothetical protein
MAISGATTAWVVSGAVGLATFTGGLLASGGNPAPAAAEPQPAVTVTVTPVPTPREPTATPSGPAKPTAGTGGAEAPSPVSPPSAETPD